jgi:hypothetical protein
MDALVRDRAGHCWHNAAMRRWSDRRLALLWTIVGTLVLKAAVPLCAAVAAQLQGVPVASICTIYGVALPDIKSDPHAGHHGHPGHHGHEAPSGGSHAHSDRDHCALTGLAAMAVPDVVLPAPVITFAGTPVRQHAAPVLRGDACAAWAACLQHPPPSMA